jgi:hypothetical protein
MQRGTPSSTPSRSLLSALRFGRKREEGQRGVVEAPSTRSSSGSNPIDEVRAAFWDCFCKLFPPHAAVSQNDNGSLVISWSLAGDPHARFKYAAPIVLRFEPELLSMMKHCTPEQRRRIASHQEATLRAALVGYDPYAGAQARIVVLG